MTRRASLTISEYDDAERARAYDKRPRTTRGEVRVLERLLGGRLTRPVVLDVPCGNGRLSGFLRSLDPELLVGLDGAPAMAREARVSYGATAAADASALPLAPNSVDALVCVRLLHHFAERDARLAILRELARVSRDLVVVTFYRRGTLEGIRRRLKRPTGRVGLSLGEVRADLAAAGLELIEVAPVTRLVREQTFVLARSRG